MSTNWLKRIAAATALVLAVSSLTACGDSTGTSETEGTAEGTGDLLSIISYKFQGNS